MLPVPVSTLVASMVKLPPVISMTPSLMMVAPWMRVLPLESSSPWMVILPPSI